MDGPGARLPGRVVLTDDGSRSHPLAVEGVPGDEVGLHKTIRRGVIGSYVERRNLTMRTSMRRFTSRTNASSKRLENHSHAPALNLPRCSFVRPHVSI